jgi:hypothetical protein
MATNPIPQQKTKRSHESAEISDSPASKTRIIFFDAKAGNDMKAMQAGIENMVSQLKHEWNKMTERVSTLEEYNKEMDNKVLRMVHQHSASLEGLCKSDQNLKDAMVNSEVKFQKIADDVKAEAIVMAIAKVKEALDVYELQLKDADVKLAEVKDACYNFGNNYEKKITEVEADLAGMKVAGSAYADNQTKLLEGLAETSRGQAELQANFVKQAATHASSENKLTQDVTEQSFAKMQALQAELSDHLKAVQGRLKQVEDSKGLIAAASASGI